MALTDSATGPTAEPMTAATARTRARKRHRASVGRMGYWRFELAQVRTTLSLSWYAVVPGMCVE